MTTWHMPAERIECHDCGELFGEHAASLDACPKCGWTAKDQEAFNRQWDGLAAPVSPERKGTP